jgi:hypothetical protein
VALGIWAVRSHETILISVVKDFSTHQNQKSSVVELRGLRSFWIGKGETETAERLHRLQGHEQNARAQRYMTG